MKKSTKITLIVILIILLLIAFYGAYKYGIKKTNVTSLPESSVQNDTDNLSTEDTDETNSTLNNTNTINNESSIPKTSNITGGEDKTNTTITRISVSLEERENCRKWQVAHGYVGDGICLQEKPYTQEYLETRDQVYPQTQSGTNQVSTPEYEMKTYTNNTYGLSFKYPADNMACEESFVVKSNNYKILTIRCGHKNLNGGVSDESAGELILHIDNGSSEYRTMMNDAATESYTAIVGANKFYDFSNGRKNLLRLFKDNYVLEVLSATNLVPPSHIDLSSLILN